MKYLDAVKDAERIELSARNAVNNAKADLSRIETKFREALSIGKMVPCKVAILPSGECVVHVWVESSSYPNQLHFVEPDFLDEEARPRKP